jgi:peptide/nickel transport system ATP-binding protein
MIAMAVAADPAVILADEPTAGLDPPVQASVLDALQSHQSRTAAALLLITHDLGVVAARADRVAVMHAGRPIETGPVDEVLTRPRTPYTTALLNSVPRLDRPDRRPPAGDPPPSVVLEVDRLAKHYPLHEGALWRRRTGELRAVDGVCLDIRAGETLGLVGESGCGKTTVLMEILRLGPPQSGRIVVFGRDTATLSAAERRRLRRDLQVVFQDPFAALDPRMTVGAVLAEPLRAHRRRDVATRVPELLRLTGLDPAHAFRYPGELSGGQRQRVGIARALALEPKLLLMDEPFSALDVSVQAGLIALLRELKTRLGLAYLLAAHDLAAVRQLADRVAVMRLGRIAEIGDADAIYETPAHPYTEALLSAADPHRERVTLPGDHDRPGGCGFRARCPRFAALAADDRSRCTDERPAPRDLGPEQTVACHFPLRSPR